MHVDVSITDVETNRCQSTVSKVLRKKEQYMNQAPPRGTPRSPPNKRTKARLPDIEKTLSAWVLKEQKKGTVISDDAIREQAYYFASIPGPDTQAANPINNPGWLEKFKLKHHVNGIGNKPSRNIRKDSVATDCDNKTPTSPSDETLSSSSPETVFPANLDNTIDTKPMLSRSNKRRKSPPSIDTALTSLGSGSACFSPQLLSPTSPFFSSSSQISSTGGLHSPFLTQNFRALDTFMVDSPPGADEDSHVFFEGVMAETKERLGSIDECMEDVSLQGIEDAAGVQDVKTVDPSALGTLRAGGIGVGGGLDKGKKTKVTEEEARKALSILVEFFEDQPRGSLDVAEGMLLGRLKGKLLR
jgi:hypothetical protein